MAYLRNAWYVGAFSNEISAGGKIGRTILDENVVFYRTEEGRIVAVQGACPHRFAPLEKGTVKGDIIQCAYHGLQFAPNGQCVHNPHGSGVIPKTARLKVYPAEERNGFVWLWMGKPEDVDQRLLPNYDACFEVPPTAIVQGYLRSAAHYELMSDNIMDLSHADFLHPETLATGEAVTKLIPNVKEEDGGVHVWWHWGPTEPPPSFVPFVTKGAMVGMTLDVMWHPASSMHIRFACQPQDGPELLNRGFHLMTPETESSTHYFFRGTRNFLMDDAEFNSAAEKQIAYVFGEQDKPIIEGVQRMIGTRDLWSMNPIILSGDAGSIRVRRKLQSLIENERVRAAEPVRA